MGWIYDPWPWYVAGPIIAIIMVLLILFGKSFGVSSNLRVVCSALGADKFSEFFKFDWKYQTWNLVFVLGAIFGGFISKQFLIKDFSVDLNPATIQQLELMGFQQFEQGFLPESIFGIDALASWQTWLFLLIGGVLVGFGTRYAGGCTSGHAISGLSNLQIPSFIAVIGFFIGGLIMTHLILPIIF